MNNFKKFTFLLAILLAVSCSHRMLPSKRNPASLASQRISSCIKSSSIIISNWLSPRRQIQRISKLISKKFIGVQSRKFNKDLFKVMLKHMNTLSELQRKSFLKGQREVGFEMAMAYTFSFLPKSRQGAYLKRFIQRRYSLKEASGLDPMLSNIIYHNLRNTNINWSKRRVFDDEDIDLLVRQTLDMYTQAQFYSFRKFNNIYTSPSKLIIQNSDMLSEKLLHQHFLLSSGINLNFPEKKWHFAFSTTWDYFIQLLSIRSRRLLTKAAISKKEISILKSGGPKALFRYNRKKYGTTFAVEYALKSAHTFFAIKFFAIIGATVPALYFAIEEFKNAKKFKLETQQDYEQASEILEYMNKNLSDAVVEITENLPKEQEEYAHDFAKELEEELKEIGQLETEKAPSMYQSIINSVLSSQ